MVFLNGDIVKVIKGNSKCKAGDLLTVIQHEITLEACLCKLNGEQFFIHDKDIEFYIGNA